MSTGTVSLQGHQSPVDHPNRRLKPVVFETTNQSISHFKVDLSLPSLSQFDWAMISIDFHAKTTTSWPAATRLHSTGPVPRRDFCGALTKPRAISWSTSVAKTTEFCRISWDEFWGWSFLSQTFRMQNNQNLEKSCGFWDDFEEFSVTPQLFQCSSCDAAPSHAMPHWKIHQDSAEAPSSVDATCARSCWGVPTKVLHAPLEC